MTVGRKLLAVAIFALAWVVVPVAGAASGPGLSGAISSDPNLSGATSVAISGHFAYTTAYFAGELTAVDFSNPASPVVAGSSGFSTGLLDASTVNIAGGYAYVVSKNRNGTNGSGSNDDGSGNSLTVLDISTNPAKPQIVGQVTDATKLFGAYGVAISGNYAYIAAQGCLSGQPCPNSAVGNSFEVVDVSNPAAPKVVASLRNSALPAPFTGTNALYHACSVAVSGHYAYVTAAYSDRLTIIDIANPLAPVIVSSLLDKTQLAFDVDVAVKGNYAYVADQASSLGRIAVVDVSNPASPQIKATVTDSATLNGAYRIRLSGNFAYVSGVYAATVTTIDISDPLSPREAAHVTDTTHLNRTTGLDVDPTSTYVVASSPYLKTQSNPIYPPFPPVGGAPTDTGTLSVIQLDRTPIGVSISGQPTNPTTQTSASFTFASTDAVSSMSCSLDGAPLGYCTSVTTQQYSGLAPGAHTFTVQAADAAGKVASANYSWTIQQAPLNTASPTISGTASPNTQLTATPGTWTGSPAPTFTYQWSDCDSTGANCATVGPASPSPTYTVQSSDVGSTLEVTVVGSNSAGSSPAISGPTSVVGGSTSAPLNTVAPSISGTASPNSQLTASPGTWTGSPAPTFTYQWSDCDSTGANCTAVGPASPSPTYTVQSSDIGFTLEVTVVGSNSAGSSSATSGPTGVVGVSTSPPVNTVAPSISGSAVEAQTLTASPGMWAGSPAPTFTYRWSDCDAAGANCTAIGSATPSNTYTVLSADVGSTVKVTVTANNSAGTVPATSQASSVVTSAPGPVTSLLDDFNRPNNTGPPSANWSHTVIASTNVNSEIVINGQQATGMAGLNGADYWNPQTFGPNSEAWMTVAAKPTLDQDSVSLGLRIQNPGTTGTASGYQAYYIFRKSQADQYRIIVRPSGGSSIILTSANGPTVNPGDKLLFRAIGSTLELWRESGTIWTRILQTTDSRIAGAGYLMVSARNTAVRVDDFGGGTLP